MAPRQLAKPYTVALGDGYATILRVKGVLATDPEKAALKALNEVLAKKRLPPGGSVLTALWALLDAQPKPVSAWIGCRGGRTPRDINRRAFRRRLSVTGPSGKRDTGAWQLWDGWFEGDHGPAPSLPYLHPSERKDRDGLTWVGLPGHAQEAIARGWFTPPDPTTTTEGEAP